MTAHRCLDALLVMIESQPEFDDLVDRLFVLVDPGNGGRRGVEHACVEGLGLPGLAVVRTALCKGPLFAHVDDERFRRALEAVGGGAPDGGLTAVVGCLEGATVHRVPRGFCPADFVSAFAGPEAVDTTRSLILCGLDPDAVGSRVLADTDSGWALAALDVMTDALPSPAPALAALARNAVRTAAMEPGRREVVDAYYGWRNVLQDVALVPETLSAIASLVVDHAVNPEAVASLLLRAQHADPFDAAMALAIDTPEAFPLALQVAEAKKRALHCMGGHVSS